MTWWAIFTLAGGTYVLKAAGPLALARARYRRRCSGRSTSCRSRCSPRWSRSARSGEGRNLVLDARAAGLGVALAAVWLRAPFAVVVIAATLTAAGLRALGIG